MKYPVWLPCPKALFRALLLALSLIPVVFSIRILSKLGAVGVLSSLLVSDGAALILSVLLSLLVGIAVPVYILAWIDQILWGEPYPKFPKWMPSPKSQGEGIFGWFLAIGVILLEVMLFADFDRDYSWRPLSDSERNGLMAFWFVTVAYAYHVRFVVSRKLKQWREIRQAKSSK